MGRSEWGFEVTDSEGIQRIVDLVAAHNKSSEVGEDLVIHAVIKHEEKFYVIASNGGGRDLTSSFILQNYQGHVLYPFHKPSWWAGCQDYVWVATPENKSILFS